MNFAPELTGIGKFNTELVSFLQSHGDQVAVLTAPPYYPQWKVEPPYKAWSYNIERDGESIVIRCPLYVPAKPTGIKRIFHLLSFAITSFPVALWAGLRFKPDVVILTEPPMMAAGGALAASRLSGAHSVLHIQDLEVDAAFGLGLIRGDFAQRAILALERFLLQRFDQISTISPGMKKQIESKSFKSRPIVLAPNWVDIDKVYPVDKEKNSFRKELGYSDTDVVLLYSGNMGRKQGLETLAGAARQLASIPNVRFLFCGEGSGRRDFEAMVGDLATVQMLPLQPVEKLNLLLSAADIHLLPQAAGAADLVMPSKLGGMLASGRPVVAGTRQGTHLFDAVDGCGLFFEPENVESLSTAICRLVEDPQYRDLLGRNARVRAGRDWNKDIILSAWRDSIVIK